MPAKRFIQRLLSGPLGLILIILTTVAVVSVAMGAPQYGKLVLYALAHVVLLPANWVWNSPDRGVWLAGAAVVSMLLVLLWWLRRRKERRARP